MVDFLAVCRTQEVFTLIKAGSKLAVLNSFVGNDLDDPVVVAISVRTVDVENQKNQLVYEVLKVNT